MSERVKEVTDNSFETEVLQSDKPVLVDFWAEWCGPCRLLAPTIEAVAEQYWASASVVKLNVDDNPTIPARFGVRGVPMMIVFARGQEVERVTGAVPKARLAAAIERALAG